MAVDSSCEGEGEPQFQEFLHGNGSLPVSCSCLKLFKPSPDDVNQRFPLEVPSIFFEETSVPAGLYQPLQSSLFGVGGGKDDVSNSREVPDEGQDLYSISVLPEEGDKADCSSPLAFLSILEDPDQSNSPMSLDAHINCQTCIDLQMKCGEVCSSCIIDIPSENGKSISTESYEEGVESFKTRNFLTRVLWRQASLKVGGSLVQFLMNLTTSRDKLVPEKVHDIPSIKWRRYKRASLLDSRKVALLFSILSSLGTLVLIYLTLKVRQRGDGFVLI